MCAHGSCYLDSDAFRICTCGCAVCAELEELVSGGGSFGSKLIPWNWSVANLRNAVKFRQGYSPDSPAVGYLLQIMSEMTAQQQRMFTRFITGTSVKRPRWKVRECHILHVSLTLSCFYSVFSFPGSPSLPGGQIQALDPPLTVVKIDLKFTLYNDPKEGAIVNLAESPALKSKGAPADPPAAPLSGPATAAATTNITHAPTNYILPTCMTCQHYLKVSRGSAQGSL
jgi:hypothetical protein